MFSQETQWRAGQLGGERWCSSTHWFSVGRQLKWAHVVHLHSKSNRGHTLPTCTYTQENLTVHYFLQLGKAHLLFNYIPDVISHQTVVCKRTSGSGIQHPPGRTREDSATATAGEKVTDCYQRGSVSRETGDHKTDEHFAAGFVTLADLKSIICRKYPDNVLPSKKKINQVFFKNWKGQWVGGLNNLWSCSRSSHPLNKSPGRLTSSHCDTDTGIKHRLSHTAVVWCVCFFLRGWGLHENELQSLIVCQESVQRWWCSHRCSVKPLDNPLTP